MTNLTDGYIKFNCIRESEKISIPDELFSKLSHWRNEMYSLGLIGMYPNGIGYGNISAKMGDGNSFYISGSATGGLSQLYPEHFALVEKCDFEKNKVWCRGEIDASAETMSHAAIYRNIPAVNAVIHIHHLKLWEKSIGKLPTTSKEVPYGTPEMAEEIGQTLRKNPSMQNGVIVMGGHEEGLIAFAGTLEEAAHHIFHLYHDLNH
jgi:ribulose-5-phosphate 4-epimerase/fuculose-1-phosphate aldolase